MQKETKRKFLVTDLSALDRQRGFPIVQGYLAKGATTVKIRTFGGFAFLTVGEQDCGSARNEFEYPIPMEEAQVMLERHCSPGLVSKTRHLIPHGCHVLEVDIFEGKLSGLVLAEIEQRAGTGDIALPPWVGTEVTSDPRFSDFSLAHMEAAPGLELEADGWG